MAVDATHLRVFERQGPMKFSRTACNRESRTRSPSRLTDDTKLVNCARCKLTKFFKEATQPEGQGDE